MILEPCIIAIIGKTRSGKDSIAQELVKSITNAVVLKFADPFKRTLEQHYGLPYKAMEDNDWRNALVPGRDITFLDLMKINYSLYEDIDPLFWRYPTIRAMDKALTQSSVVVLTDIRHPLEARIVSDQSFRHPLHLIRVTRNGCDDILPDSHLEENWETLKKTAVSSQEYVNDKTLDDLKNFVKKGVLCQALTCKI